MNDGRRKGKHWFMYFCVVGKIFGVRFVLSSPQVHIDFLDLKRLLAGLGKLINCYSDCLMCFYRSVIVIRHFNHTQSQWQSNDLIRNKPITIISVIGIVSN